MIELRNVTAGYDEDDIIKSASVLLPKGRLTALIGPNGSGKSTLLRAMAGLLPVKGDILYSGLPIAKMEREERARLLSFMPQQRNIPDISAYTMVTHGRYPHMGFSKKPSATDREHIERAISLTRTGPLMHKRMAALSGGERQRVYLAMLLAQDCDYLLLDEPLTYLDISAQLEMIALISELCKLGKTMVVAIHDLPQAFTYADTVCLLQQGRVCCCRPPDDPCWAQHSEQAFGVCVTHCPGGDGLFTYSLCAGRRFHTAAQG